MSTNFAKPLLSWFHQHGRHDLPWQHPRTPYRVWLSEIMLQQTQVATVIPYFERFIARFPDIDTLATAGEDEVLHYWSGLGYYARARNLFKTAQIIHQQYNNQFPSDQATLMTLPGIGRSTAAAIVSQAFNIPAAILDGNAKRVIARYFRIEGWPGQTRILNSLWEKAEQITPDNNAADFTQAIMDLGSMICTRSSTACNQCPLADSCLARIQQCIDSCPGKKPKKTLPVKQTRMLLIQNRLNEILLIKRPPTGIWGGLWSLPEVATDEDIRQACEQRFALQTGSPEPIEQFKHSFSHYHLLIDAYRVQANNPANLVMESTEWLWYNTQQPEGIGLPRPVQQLIQTHYQQQKV